MARWEWTAETQKEFEKMQEKCIEFFIVINKFREKVKRAVEYMEDIDSAVSKFEYEVDIMEEKFRQMKYNCF